jgi:esterase/lipase superfamily enzyme
MRTVTFVTNRPPTTAGFGPPPPCPAQESLSFGSASVEPSSDPAKSGHLVAPVSVHGADACTAAAPDAQLIAYIQRALAAAAQDGRTPIVVVHGYSYSFQDAVLRTGDLCAWLEAGDFPVDLAPILFTWPSINGLSPDNYLADRGRGEASAQALCRFIQAYAAAWSAYGQPRSLYLAHSMGTWVSQNGMRALAASGHKLPADLFEQAVIMGGDADTNALEPGQGLDQLARISEWLSIGVNRTDFATGVTSADILKRPRLGSSGPADVARIPRNARIIDYTMAIGMDRSPTPPGETTWNYTLHQYYRTVPAVREDLGAILSGGDPDQIEGRFTSEQMIRAGQPYIVPGRLYFCPSAAPQPTQFADIDVAERRG